MTDPVTTPDTERLRGRYWRECAEELQATVVKLQDDEEALLARLQAAEHRATRAEAQSAIRGRAVVIYRERAREAEAERDWNIRSSRLAKEERIKANARAESAEARIRDLTQEVRDERGAALDALEQIKVRNARIKAVRAIHRDLYESLSGVPYCVECDRAWPCPTIRALDGDA